MSNIDVRYIVRESEWDHFKFDVIDQISSSGYPVCSCHRRENAGMIAGLLNGEKEKQEKEEFEKQVEGVRREIVGGE